MKPALHQVGDERLTVRQLAARAGVKLATMARRISSGVPAAEALAPLMHNVGDMTGQTFGELEVLGEAGRTAAGKRTWRVRCRRDGNEKIVVGGDLRTGRTTSCGCLRAKGASERASARAVNIAGQVFGGGIKAIRLSEQKRRSKGAGSKYTIRLWECLCVCGALVFATAASLKLGQVTGCGCVHRERTTQALKDRAERVEFFGEAMTLRDVEQVSGVRVPTLHYRRKVRGMTLEQAALAKAQRNGNPGVKKRCRVCRRPRRARGAA